MANIRILCCGLALAALAIPAQAQAPAAGGAQEASKLVRLNVVALDSAGQPVKDLTADDFRITDEGKPQKITLFHNVGAGPAPAAGAHEFSNRPVPAPHTTAILFDFLNMLVRSDRLDQARKIGPSLKQLPSGESVFFYLLALDGKLTAIHPFPEPGAASDKNWNQDIESVLAKAVKANSGTRPAGMPDEEVTKKTYVALETLANGLAAFPGRRDILWVTTGVPYTWPVKQCAGDWIECGLYVPHLSVTIDRAGATVSPFSYVSVRNPETTRTLEDMAALTGGRTYFGEEMHTVIKQLGEEPGGTYSLAYDPSRENFDNKFHKVKITCERKGVKLQPKQRYYALPDQRPAMERERAALVGAYQSPSDTADIGLRAVVSPAADKVRVELRVDPSDVALHEQGNDLSGQLTVLFSARAATGPQGEPNVSTLDVHVTREQRKDGIPFTREYPIDGNTQKIRMIVLDRGTNSVGSITVPVK